MPHRWRRIRDTHCCAPVLQRVRPVSSALEPLHRSTRDFASRLLNDRPALIFEDGEQRRDFVSVHDIARACSLALTSGSADGAVINIGSGHSVSVKEIYDRLTRVLDKAHIPAEVTGKYRVGVDDEPKS